jgi:hypothetical protein
MSLDAKVADANLINAAYDIHADDPTFGYRFIADEQPAKGITARDRALSWVAAVIVDIVTLLPCLCADRWPALTLGCACAARLRLRSVRALISVPLGQSDQMRRAPGKPFTRTWQAIRLPVVGGRGKPLMDCRLAANLPPHTRR